MNFAAGGGKVRVTWYTAADNDPPGTYAVAYSSLASNGRDAKGMGYADGAGTKDNPVALAQPKGSKKIKKGGYYTIRGEGDKPFCGRVVDTCAACRDSGGGPRLDVFVGKNSKGHPKWDYATVKKGC